MHFFHLTETSLFVVEFPLSMLTFPFAVVVVNSVTICPFNFSHLKFCRHPFLSYFFLFFLSYVLSFQFPHCYYSRVSRGIKYKFLFSHVLIGSLISVVHMFYIFTKYCEIALQNAALMFLLG